MSFFQKIKELFQPQESVGTVQKHDDWYYHTKIFARTLVLFYKDVIEAVQEDTTLKTAQDLLATELPFNISESEVVAKWGKPRCSFANDKIDHNIKILFYRRPFVYQNTLVQLQFYNDRLFFAAVEVGRSIMSEATKVSMVGNFLPNIVTNSFSNIKKVPIIQSHQPHFVLIQDDVNLNILYLSGEFVGDKFIHIEQAFADLHISSVQ